MSDGTTGHIDLSEGDQINLSAAKDAVDSGATQYPYHLNNNMCILYSATDIKILASSATAHKLYHTTLFNHYHVWINRCTTAEELSQISYGCVLPDDLKANMEAIMNAIA